MMHRAYSRREVVGLAGAGLRRRLVEDGGTRRRWGQGAGSLRLGLRSGAVLAAHGDSGHGDPHGLETGGLGEGTSASPWMAGYSLDLSQHFGQVEALRVNTIDGAHATREEAIKGSTTPGKLADFVLLKDDLHTVDPSRIRDVKVVRTVVSGATVFQA